MEGRAGVRGEVRPSAELIRYFLILVHGLESPAKFCDGPDLMQYALTKATKRITTTRKRPKDQARGSDEREDFPNDAESVKPICDDPAARQLSFTTNPNFINIVFY